MAKSPIPKLVWELVVPQPKGGHDVTLVTDGQTALRLMSAAPKGSILRPCSYRVTPGSKDLAHQGKSFIVTISPITEQEMKQRAAPAQSEDERFQRVGRAVDKFVSTAVPRTQLDA